MTSLEEIRAEYMRGLPDSYACGARARERNWERLAELIDAYAAQKPAPTIATDAPPVAEHATPQRTTTRRKAQR